MVVKVRTMCEREDKNGEFRVRGLVSGSEDGNLEYTKGERPSGGVVGSACM